MKQASVMTKIQIAFNSSLAYFRISIIATDSLDYYANSLTARPFRNRKNSITSISMLEIFCVRGAEIL